MFVETEKEELKMCKTHQEDLEASQCLELQTDDSDMRKA